MRGRERGGEGERERDTKVVFTKVRLMVSNCTLAKCSHRERGRKTDQQTEILTQLTHH